MRRFFSILLCLTLVDPAMATITLRGSQTTGDCCGSGTSFALPAFVANATAGDTFIVSCEQSSNVATAAPTDSQSNTGWTQVGSQSCNGTTKCTAMWYVANVKAGATTITCHWGSSATAPGGVAQEFQNINTSTPLDNSCTATGSSTLATCNVNTTNANTLIIGGAAGGTVSVASGFSNFQGDGNQEGQDSKTVTASGSNTGSVATTNTTWAIVTGAFIDVSQPAGGTAGISKLKKLQKLGVLNAASY